MVEIIKGERVGEKGRLAVGCSAAVINDQQKILLIRRADNEFWAVPGGYMEPGESLTEACVREVMEETGLNVQVQRLISVYTNPHLLLAYPDGNRWQLVVLHFAATPTGGELTSSNESTEVQFFSEAETKGLQMSLFDQLRVSDAFSASKTTLIRDEF